MSASGADWPRSIVVDSGVLVAAIDADEPHHTWAKHTLTTLVGRFFTCEACLTEAVHRVDNSAPAISGLMKLAGPMQLVSFAEGSWRAALDEVRTYAPSMDYADACVVLMVRERRGAFALTLDQRDFSKYRVPFASPYGEYYERP